MPEKSEIVESFERIKSEALCDDVSAAILTLAQYLSSIQVYVSESEGYDFNRVGKDIADAIEAVSKDGAIQLNVDADVFGKVLGQIDTSGGPSKAEKPTPKKSRRKGR